MLYQGCDLQRINSAKQLREVIKDTVNIDFEYSREATSIDFDLLLKMTDLCADKDMITDFTSELEMAEKQLEEVVQKLQEKGLLLFAGERKEEPDVAKTILICVLSEDEVEYPL